MSDDEVTWTDDDGVTHGLMHGLTESTWCGARVTIKVYDGRLISCLDCIGRGKPRFRPTGWRPQMQQIPRTRKGR